MTSIDPNATSTHAVSVFAEIAQKYEKSLGGATRYVAAKLMGMSPPLSADSKVLDNACGPGVVIDELQRHITTTTPDAKLKLNIIAADAAPPMIGVLDSKIEKARGPSTWPDIASVSTHVVRAEELDSTIVPDNSITHSYMNFGLFFCSDPVQAAQHIYRSLAPGGTALVTSWNDLGYIHAVRKTEKMINPGNEDFAMPFGTVWEDPQYAKEILVRSGFSPENVKVLQEESFMRFESVAEAAATWAEAFITFFRGKSGFQTDEEKALWVDTLCKNLAEDNHFMDEGEKGVAVRMLANVAIATK